jgi:hypothetical protein
VFKCCVTFSSLLNAEKDIKECDVYSEIDKAGRLLCLSDFDGEIYVRNICCKIHVTVIIRMETKSLIT